MLGIAINSKGKPLPGEWPQWVPYSGQTARRNVWPSAEEAAAFRTRPGKHGIAARNPVEYWLSITDKARRSEIVAQDSAGPPIDMAYCLNGR